MGYEVTFYFFEKEASVEDFDKSPEKLKNKTLNVGEATEPISPEKVAATILKKFIDPNIWIDKIEVFEWTKKPLKYTESKTGGVKLGSKTYNLGLNEIMKWAVNDNPPVVPPPQPVNSVQLPTTSVTSPITAPVTNPIQDNTGQKVWPHEQMSPRPQSPVVNTTQNKLSQAGLQYESRAEICDPPEELRSSAINFRLTLGKQYQILDEQLVSNPNSSLGQSLMYKIINDQGREAMISCRYFRPPQKILEEVSFFDQAGNLHTTSTYVDQASTPTQSEHRPQLMYDNAGHGGTGLVQVDNMMARMDAAIQRRLGRR